MRLRLERPWLIAELPGPRRVLSWSLNQPGFAEARRIVWREVRNADLPRELDARAWLVAELRRADLEDAVCLVTSRDIGAFSEARAAVDGETVVVAATVGLSNAERIGARSAAPIQTAAHTVGTINIAVLVGSALSDGAMLEVMSLAAEARTLAVLEAGLSRGDGPATGTGTDCIAIAAPPGTAAHAGKHTALGEAVGRATLAATRRGVEVWMKQTRKGEAYGGD